MLMARKPYQCSPNTSSKWLNFQYFDLLKLATLHKHRQMPRSGRTCASDREHTRSAWRVQLDQLLGQWSVPWQLLFKCNAEWICHHQWLLMLLPCIIQLQATATLDIASTMTRITVDQKFRRPLGSPRRLSSRTRNPITSPRMKQLMWLRTVHSGDVYVWR